MTTQPHRYYASTACQHGDHTYCQSHTGLSGAKNPAQCKFCALPCACTCHNGDAAPYLPPDPAVADLRRELDKALGVLLQCGTYLTHHAEMNAALHCASNRVVHSPLHSTVTIAIARLHTLLEQTAPPADPAAKDSD